MGKTRLEVEEKVGRKASCRKQSQYKTRQKDVESIVQKALILALLCRCSAELLLPGFIFHGFLANNPVLSPWLRA